MTAYYLIGVVLLLSLTGLAAAPEPADNDLGRMQVRTLAPMRYLHLATRTSFEGGRLPKDIDAFITRIMKDTAAGTIPAPSGALVFIYDGVGQAPEFGFSIGFELRADQKPANLPEGYKITELPAYKAATAIYTGNLQGIPPAWGELSEQAKATLLDRDGTGREYYLHWEGEQSSNNVVMIAVGMK